MNIPLSKIKDTFSGVEYVIPKVNKNVLYICLHSGCGYQVISELQIESITSVYTRRKICPGCSCTMWKIIK